MRRDDFFIQATRYFALLVGTAFTLAGIAGFLPMFTQPLPTGAPHLQVEISYGLLLGLFPVNILHNLFHFGTGIFGLAAFRAYSPARLFSRFLGVTLALFTLMGITPQLNTTFGLLPLYGHDVWLHGIEAVVGLYLGFFISQPAKAGEGSLYVR